MTKLYSNDVKKYERLCKEYSEGEWYSEEDDFIIVTEGMVSSICQSQLDNVQGGWIWIN